MVKSYTVLLSKHKNRIFFGKKMSTAAFKLVLLGEGRVGKTSLVLRYVRNDFNKDEVSTIQATYLDKRINIGKQSVKLMIWDTAGQERYHALGPIYYRDANGAFLVYDITDAESFHRVQQWIKELRKVVGDISLVIAGNKCDLEKNRQVDQAEAEKYAASVGAIHVHTSAKTGKGVNEGFLSLTKKMMQSYKPTGSRSSKIVIVDEPKKDSSCC